LEALFSGISGEQAKGKDAFRSAPLRFLKGKNTMATFNLYYSTGACSLACHVILSEAGADYSLTKVDLGEHKTEDGRDFYAINPKGYTPALELEDGYVLTEGPAINQYIADTHPYANLAPTPGTVERAKVQEDLTFIGTEIHKSFSPLFNPALPADQAQAQREKIGKRFDLFEKRLSDGRDYLGGSDFSVADAYLFVMTRWSGNMGIDMAGWPHLKAYKDRITARPKVQAALAAEGLA
jgi:glutathione S-transferase